MADNTAPVILNQRLWAVIDDLNQIAQHRDVFALGPDKQQVLEEARFAARTKPDEALPVGWRIINVRITEVLPE